MTLSLRHALASASPRTGPAAPGRRAGLRGSDGAFAINGRFLSQPVTGVQRYAREITGELDAVLAGRGQTARLVAPRLSAPPDPYRAIALRAARRGGGQVWEQFVLPLEAGGGGLLNLCNTAPLAVRDICLCIHDTNTLTAADSYSLRFRAFYRALQPMLLRRGARVTTVSAHAAGEIARAFGLRAADIAVLPNGHEHALRWRASASGLAAGAGNTGRPFVLMVGSLARHKNIAVVLRLADALDALGCDIRLVGAPAGIFAAADVGRAANVSWLGKVSDDDLAFLFDRALCLAFPSLSEGFGLPVLEAMARGCPVVASRASSLPEVCGPDALLADPTDPQPWLDHIAALLASRPLRDEQRERGREQARRFSWGASAQGYHDLMSRS